jgi:hypothetical protein
MCRAPARARRRTGQTSLPRARDRAAPPAHGYAPATASPPPPARCASRLLFVLPLAVARTLCALYLRSLVVCAASGRALHARSLHTHAYATRTHICATRQVSHRRETDKDDTDRTCGHPFQTLRIFFGRSPGITAATPSLERCYSASTLPSAWHGRAQPSSAPCAFARPPTRLFFRRSASAQRHPGQRRRSAGTQGS